MNMVAEQLNDLFARIVIENIASEINPETIYLIGSETIGELLEKLQILNTRIWILEDESKKI